MDGGLSKLNNCFYERGYYRAFPSTGLPVAGSTISSLTLPASYTMPSSYAGNCAFVLATNVTSANIAFTAPAAYRALSFLCGAANGDSTNLYTINFADGTSESGFILIPDWFNRVVPPAFHAFGRVLPYGNAVPQTLFGFRIVNSTPDQFNDRFVANPPLDHDDDFRPTTFTLPTVYLFDSVINVTNTASAITNVSLSFTNPAGSTRVTAIFAVSGAAAASVPPQFGVHNTFGSATPSSGQPAAAVITVSANKAFAVRNDRTLVKAWEGTNVVVLSVTNIAAGAEPVSYQWRKASRGQGFHDIHFTVDHNLFANVANGGRISGATSSALVISNALTADSADYLVVASNGAGAITSRFATVMILSTNGSVLVGAPAGDVIAPIAADASPAAEALEHAIDQVAQKWLSDGLQSATCCGGPFPFVGPIGFTVTPVSGTPFVTAMRWFTANDSQARDPYDYLLEGSNDGGATWAPITGGAFKGSLFMPIGRNLTGAVAVDPLAQNVIEVNFPNAVSYKSYRVSITNTVDNYGNALMQIGEIQLLGTFVPAPPTWVRQPCDGGNVTAFVGASPTFTAKASGIGALTPRYQWRKNGSPIAGATSSAYTFPNAQLADTGTTFSCLASNTSDPSIITSCSVTLSVIAAPTQTYPVAVNADNPIGYWRLNEADNGSGNNGVIAHDYRGGHNGSYSNSINGVAGYNSTYDPDTASFFAEIASPNSYVANINDVDFARTAGSGGATFSIEAWVNASNQTVNAAIVAKGYNGILNIGTGTGTEQYALDVAGADPRKFRFLVRDAAGQGYQAQSTVVPYDTATGQPTWRHVVGVCDQPNGTIKLYVDSLLVASGTISNNSGIQKQPQAMSIGARKATDASDFTDQWHGTIDDVAIYNTALTAAQVLNHFNAAGRPPIITLHPVNTTTNENVAVTFYSAGYGAGNVGFQWYASDGSNPTAAIAGGNTSNLTFTTTAAQNGNYYQVVATNEYGSSTSLVAQLTVSSGAPGFLPAPPFADLPGTLTLFKGHVAQLSVIPSGTAPFTYQWTKGGANIADNYRIYGSQSRVLTIICVDPSDAGTYQVTVSGQGTTPSTMCVVTVATGGTPAFAAGGTGWTLQGTVPAGQPAMPVMDATRLQLTENLGNTFSSAFFNTPVSVAGFTASFVYQDAVPGAGGADGITFCIQNDTRGAAALGGGGGALGYSGITPSYALAMNIYDPNTRGINFLQNGVLPAAGAGAYAPITPVLVGGNANPIQVTLTYNGTVLNAVFRDLVTTANTFTTNRTVDIPGIVGSTSAFVGFTGADGGVFSTQYISNFVYAPPPVRLRIQTAGAGSALLAWPLSGNGCLQSTPVLGNPSVWSDVTETQRIVGSEVQVTVPASVGTKFYRLLVYP